MPSGTAVIGQTIGSYHITAKLGAGGMGDVYRATDTRLGREVAMKFPAERFSERFEREARAVAALNHPNICTLYDVAPDYLVMELVEGVTLADRIAEGPLPLEDALGIARQIAAALEEAHDKGITHRDLKPANVKIRPDGTVKVLDFGLAKVASSSTTTTPDAAAAMSLSPTISMAATQAGVIVGTAAYMAPEQAKGKPVEKRADIWSFDSSDKTEPLSIKPDVYLHPRLSPDGTRIALTLRSTTGQEIWVHDPRRDTMLRLTYGGGENQFPVWTPDGHYIVFTSGMNGGGIFWTRADGASQPQRLTQSKYGQFPWSFSPDGKRLAYAEFPAGAGDIWTVPVDDDGTGLKAGKPELFLQTPANELYPAFSSDGRWIAYRSFESGSSEIYVRAFPDNGGKWLISTGGGIVPIWSGNGRELFYRTADQRIMVVNYTQKDGAFFPDKPREWNDIRLTESGQRNLDITPDGKRFIALLPATALQAQTQRNHVTFLQNFTDELGRRLGPSTARPQ